MEVLLLLWEDLVEQILCLPLFLQVGLCPLLHQVLQVIGILFHSGQQVIENAGAPLPARISVRHL